VPYLPLRRLTGRTRITAEKARKEYDVKVPYLCPKCDVGLHLEPVSIPSDEVKCTQCNVIYLKP